MNKRIEAKYLVLDQKLLKVNQGTLYFDNKKVAMTPSASTPAYPSAPGTAGDIAYDNAYLYICVSTNTWVRAALSEW
jgi:hypothetical protein